MCIAIENNNYSSAYVYKPFRLGDDKLAIRVIKRGSPNMPQFTDAKVMFVNPDSQEVVHSEEV